jgi:hypothetical protein
MKVSIVVPEPVPANLDVPEKMPQWSLFWIRRKGSQARRLACFMPLSVVVYFNEGALCGWDQLSTVRDNYDFLGYATPGTSVTLTAEK